jgi:hypothetical protein
MKVEQQRLMGEIDQIHSHYCRKCHCRHWMSVCRSAWWAWLMLRNHTRSRFFTSFFIYLFSSHSHNSPIAFYFLFWYQKLKMLHVPH